MCDIEFISEETATALYIDYLIFYTVKRLAEILYNIKIVEVNDHEEI